MQKYIGKDENFKADEGIAPSPREKYSVFHDLCHLDFDNVSKAIILLANF